MISRRALPAGLAMVLAGLVPTVATAVPLAALGTAGHEPPRGLVGVHVGAAVLLGAGLAVKLLAIGRRAVLLRARRFWASLVAVLALGLAAYCLLTGVLVVADPRWSNQHLAAGFWTTGLLVAHARHRRARARRLLAAPAGRFRRCGEPGGS